MSANPLQTIHEQAEAAFVAYGDFQIVESYGEMEAEYAAIRKSAALLDAPHRSVVVLTGKDRLTFLQNKLTNDVARLAAGQGCYSFLLNVKGRIQQDLNLLHGEDATLVELDARLAGGFVKQMEHYRFSEDVKFLDASEQSGRLTLLGPRAAELLKKVADGDMAPLAHPLRHIKRIIARETVTIFRNDLAGDEQYELLAPRSALVKLWQVLHEAGDETLDPAAVDLRAIGWSAYNIARIEAGTPVFGIDITDSNLPMETGPAYAHAVSSTKGCYLGQEVVARMHAHNTVARMLVGLKIAGDALPVAATDIFDGAAQVGMITSSCVSPMLGGVPVALGYVKRAYATPGRVVEVLAEGQRAKAVVSELPLWRRA